MSYYYAKDGQQAGPVDDAELARLINERQIRGNTLVWKEGMPDWLPYQQIWKEGMPDWRGSDSGTMDVPPMPDPQTAQADWESGGLPFATPPILVEAAQRREPLSPMACLREGWDLFKLETSSVFGGFLLAMLCIIGISSIPIVGGCIGFLINAPLVAGMWWVCIRGLRRQGPGVGDVFAGFSRSWLRLVLTGLITTLLGWIPLIPVGIAAYVWGRFNFGNPPEPTVVVGFVLLLLAVVPISIAIGLLLLFAAPLVIDRGYDIGDALSASWRVSIKQTLPLLGLFLVSLLLQLTGALACCVGLLITMPVGIAAYCVAYEELFGSRVKLS
ncbi:MAG: DUF4339 domain-containing protein [Verrucomicrobia bacterium]|nr:DUF4339 domain-containing protein [Verrucomicrobiota bacterium]